MDDDTVVTRSPNKKEPFSALLFKVSTDPFVGTLCFLRVYSGTLDAGASVYNSVQRKKERIGRLVKMHANNREEVKQVSAGDIVAAIGLKDATTGDTLCDISSPIVLEKIDVLPPVIDLAIEPKTKSDQEKLGTALQKLKQEDPSFQVKTDEESGQVVIAGMGELHLEIKVDLLNVILV